VTTVDTAGKESIYRGRPDYLTSSGGSLYLGLCAVAGLLLVMVGPVLLGLAFAGGTLGTGWPYSVAMQAAEALASASWGVIGLCVALAAASLTAVAFVGMREPTQLTLQKHRRLGSVAKAFIYLSGALLAMVSWGMIFSSLVFSIVESAMQQDDSTADPARWAAILDRASLALDGVLSSLVAFGLLIIFQQLYVAVELWLDNDDRFEHRESTQVAARIEVGEYLLQRVQRKLFSWGIDPDVSKAYPMSRRPTGEGGQSRGSGQGWGIAIRSILGIAVATAIVAAGFGRWSVSVGEALTLCTALSGYQWFFASLGCHSLMQAYWAGPKLSRLVDASQVTQLKERVGIRSCRRYLLLAVPSAFIIPLLGWVLLRLLHAPVGVQLQFLLSQSLLVFLVVLPGRGSWHRAAAWQGYRIIERHLTQDRRWQISLNNDVAHHAQEPDPVREAHRKLAIKLNVGRYRLGLGVHYEKVVKGGKSRFPGD